MGNEFITYKGRDNKYYEAWRGGDDWYYRPVGEKGMTRVPYNYITPEGDVRFYKSTDRGAVAKTFNEVAEPFISKSKKSNFIPKESNLNSNGTALQTVTATAPRIKKLTISQKPPLNSRVNSTLKPKVNTQTSLKKEAPKILVTALKPNSGGKTVKNNITPKLHYTRNYKQRVSELGLNDRDAVKAIQRQLGVYDDGIWGDNTERAYRTYQISHGNTSSENYNNAVFNTNVDLTNAPTVAKVPNTLNFLNPGMFLDIINRPLSQLTFAKNGAKLVSKNPIKRFKSFKKC